MVKRRKYKRPKATKCNANEQFFNIANIDGSHKVNTQDEDAGKANTSMSYLQELNNALIHMDDGPEVAQMGRTYASFFENCRSDEELRRLAVDVDFLSYQTQHENEAEVYHIRRILGEKRDAKGRWLKVERHPDHISKEQATKEELEEWQEYKRLHPDGDRVFQHMQSPFGTPTILGVTYGVDGEVTGYTRTFAPRYELVKDIHFLLVEEWEESDEYQTLAVQNGW